MPITISGSLVSPDSTPIVGATIRFIATSNSTDGTVKGTMAETDTAAAGAYSIDILPGSYKVEFKNPSKDKYITLGNVTLDASLVGPLALQELGIS